MNPLLLGGLANIFQGGQPPASQTLGMPQGQNGLQGGIQNGLNGAMTGALTLGPQGALAGGGLGLLSSLFGQR
jgi:hypothetical protein